VVGEIQRSLLPTELPEIPTLALAAHYRTSQRAGGDYYDLFPLPDSRWGLFIADVSGHGTPAAVMMAVTHAIAHWPPPPPESPESAYSPAAMMARLNKTLHDSYTRGNGTFVTAFYGVFDAATREMVYSSAGHNPPRLRRGGRVSGLTEAASLPLGILPSGEEGGAVYGEARVKLEPGDLLLLYTDGIVEAMDGQNRLFSMPRLDRVLEESRDGAHGAIEAVNRAVEAFADGRPPNDDRTILAAQVR
jgi:sigma-B regulation protein RsbU (phosphoserine phosphatase)